MRALIILAALSFGLINHAKAISIHTWVEGKISFHKSLDIDSNKFGLISDFWDFLIDRQNINKTSLVMCVGICRERIIDTSDHPAHGKIAIATLHTQGRIYLIPAYTRSKTPLFFGVWILPLRENGWTYSKWPSTDIIAPKMLLLKGVAHLQNQPSVPTNLDGRMSTDILHIDHNRKNTAGSTERDPFLAFGKRNIDCEPCSLTGNDREPSEIGSLFGGFSGFLGDTEIARHRFGLFAHNPLLCLYRSNLGSRSCGGIVSGSEKALHVAGLSLGKVTQANSRPPQRSSKRCDRDRTKSEKKIVVGVNPPNDLADGVTDSRDKPARAVFVIVILGVCGLIWWGERKVRKFNPKDDGDRNRRKHDDQ